MTPATAERPTTTSTATMKATAAPVRDERREGTTGEATGEPDGAG